MSLDVTVRGITLPAEAVEHDGECLAIRKLPRDRERLVE